MRHLACATLLLGAVLALAGCERDAGDREPDAGTVPVTGDGRGPPADIEHATALGGERDPDEAGWHRRRVAEEPVLVAGDDPQPLAVELTDLEPGRDHEVLVAYVLPLAAGQTTGWGVRAGLADDDELAHLDHAQRRHQLEPANPWIFEASVGRVQPDADGTLEATVAALEGAETAVASVRALPAVTLEAMPARDQRELSEEAVGVVPEVASDAFPSADDYMLMLQRWPAYAEQGFTDGHAGHSDLGYFGDGTADEQGMRTLGNFVYAYALLAGDERYDPDASGVARSQLERRARQALRYMTRTHETGDLTAVDDEAWGDHWQSSWWTSRMAGGAMLLWDRLDADEQSGVRRVVTAEADRQVERDPPSGVDEDSKAEENAWDTEVLAWALALFPDHPDAGAWRVALNRWAMNALSVAADADDDRTVEGRSVGDWNETVNVYDDFTIENHGAYHAGYMAWPLQSLTWGVYALAAAGEPVPETLLHNFRPVWERLRAGYLGEGQFLYAGGKDWPQHLYGLYAIVPPTVLLQHLDGDRMARSVEADRVRTYEWEQRLWGDGGWFSGRVTGHTFHGWDAEFESDAAAILGMAYHLAEVLERDGVDLAPGGGDQPRPDRLEAGELAGRLAGGFYSADAAFAAARHPGLVTAFGWQTLDCCFGAVSEHHDILGVVSGDDPSMIAWAEGQLAGSFALADDDDPPLGVRWHRGEELDGGGYATVGVRWIGGSADAPALDQQLAMVSLPQTNRALVLDQPVARQPIELAEATGLDWHVPNDVFNRLQRRVVSGAQELTVPAGLEDRDVELPARWVNVDGVVGVAADGSDGTLELRTRAERNLAWDSLRSETLRWLPTEPPQAHAPGEPVRRLALAFHGGGPAQTRQLSEEMGMLDTGMADVAAAWTHLEDRDDVVVVAANFADGPREVVLDGGALPGSGAVELELPPRSVEVVGF